MIYAYAVCEPAAVEPPPDGLGLNGATLRVAVIDGLAAVYSRHRALRPRPSPAAMWAHERAVEAVMGSGSVLPMRFGTVLADEAALTGALVARHDELMARLRDLRGRVELGLRLTPDRGGPAEASGREYLLARVREQRSARELHAALAELAHESRRSPRPVPPAVLAGAYLVDRDAVPGFQDRVEELAAARPELRATCTGPWPPYSFAGEEDA